MSPEKRNYKVTLERARAWLVSVINPLLQGLRVEEDYLQRKLWTWRFHRGQCEVLDFCRDMIPSAYQDNFDDLREKKPELDRLVREHDDRLKSLHDALSKSQARMERELSDEVNRALAEHKVAHPTDQPAGASDEGELPSLVAQFVLNNVTVELTAHDSTMHKFWKGHGEAFLRTRATRFAAEIAAVDHAGEALFNSVRTLAKALRKTRTELCDEYGLPPVPLSSERQVRVSEQF